MKFTFHSYSFSFHPMKTLLISGNTYPHRRTLRNLGAMFDYTLKAYICNDSEPLQAFLTTAQYLEQSPHTTTTLDESFEVQQKNIKSQLLADKLEAKSERLANLSDNTNPPEYIRDFLSLGEPIKIGHHSEHRHRRTVEKYNATLDKKYALAKESEEAARLSEYHRAKTFRTQGEKDALKAKAKAIQALACQLYAQDHKPGDTYNGCHTGPRIISKVNKTTCTLDTGSKWEISYTKEFPEYVAKAKAQLEKENSK